METPMKITKFCLASGAAMTLIIGTLPALAYTGEEMANPVKVSIAEARAIALKAYPGTITDEELDNQVGAA
jgi:hypothetical protein